ncbi:MAG: phosphate-starvation-inducible PsiE family protein [Bacteroidales bacterium]
MAKKIQSFAHRLERFIIHALVFMMSVVLVLATIELAYSIFIAAIKPPVLLLEFDEILDLFGVFLLVLIGIELLDTIKVYFKRNVVHVEVVVLVAIIAISRKVIVLEPKDYEPGTLMGIGLIILALSISYFLIKKLGCEMISIKKLPKSSQEVIKDEIKETGKIIGNDDVKIDLSQPAEENEKDRGDEKDKGNQEGGDQGKH